MRLRPDEPLLAWVPLTPRGVAAFARVPLRRLVVAQLVFAAAAGLAFVWMVQNTWVAAVQDALEQLPAQGQIQGGQLDWTNDVPAELAGGRFLKFIVDPDHSGAASEESDLCLELGRTNLWVISLFGYVEAPYPPDWTVALNRPEFQPWWNAREPFFRGGAGVALGLVLLALWDTLAVVYGLVVWVLAWFANRALRPAGAWQLAAAAQLPGTLLLAGGFLAYGLGWLPLVHLLSTIGFSFVVAWGYVLSTPFLLPPGEAARASQRNPFAGRAPSDSGTTRKQPETNPFSRK